MIDSKHRLRPERISKGKPSVLRDLRDLIVSIVKMFAYLVCCCGRFRKSAKGDEDEDDEHEQRRPLLN